MRKKVTVMWKCSNSLPSESLTKNVRSNHILSTKYLCYLHLVERYPNFFLMSVIGHIRALMIHFQNDESHLNFHKNGNCVSCSALLRTLDEKHLFNCSFTAVPADLLTINWVFFWVDDYTLYIFPGTLLLDFA